MSALTFYLADTTIEGDGDLRSRMSAVRQLFTYFSVKLGKAALAFSKTCWISTSVSSIFLEGAT